MKQLKNKGYDRHYSSLHWFVKEIRNVRHYHESYIYFLFVCLVVIALDVFLSFGQCRYN